MQWKKVLFSMQFRGKSQVGIISDRIRQLPRTVRSLHPTHSATFVGSFARDLTEEQG
jgi:aminoglycoside N3'-acetyltransferase